MTASGAEADPLRPLGVLMSPAEPTHEPAEPPAGELDPVAEATLVAQVADARSFSGLAAPCLVMRAGPEQPMRQADFDQDIVFADGNLLSMRSSPMQRAVHAAEAIAADLGPSPADRPR